MSKVVNRNGIIVQEMADFMSVVGLPHNGTLQSVAAATWKAFCHKDSFTDLVEREVLDRSRREIMFAINRLGMLAKVSPELREYHDAIIVGGGIADARKRIRYLSDLTLGGLRYTNIVFMVGERPLPDSECHCPEEVFNRDNRYLPFRSEWKSPARLPYNELGRMQTIWEQADLPEVMRKTPIQWCCAPMNISEESAYFPEAKDLVSEWLYSDANPGISCLVVSNQPYIKYHESVFETLLPQSIKVDVVGPKADFSLGIEEYLRVVALWLDQERARLEMGK